MPAPSFASRRRHRHASAAAAALLALTATFAAPAAQAAEMSALPDASRYIDDLGRPTPLAVAKVNEFASQPFVPAEAADALRAAVSFFAGTGEIGGPPLPSDAPTFAQFIWPTVSLDCIGEGLHSTASAIAVPGPAEIPTPGAGPGQAAFVFTALGTPPAATDQGLLNAYWINLDTLRTGVTPLVNNGINPLGPATLSGTADTGSGRVLAVVGGSVRTSTNVCAFAPTAASFHVR
ncbi:Rv1157c family protein [Corynebacterium sanguinis]|uniref:Secreted protein n=1 Tax=Corynebacterium sanguinis TaxID=2594913 RepID=A0A6C1TYU4_9CORY|nr:hypothetical protein [Corynebacterium sanguinis]MCT1412326.1 hypothetical protein [Corynebacterium sanguinis]MCT1413979.1 hypothetical protein [Corynebacterium sanguinis]MCT1444510.1 hypothetical protein [Corynebacterium sanguinis]MCT1463848.1 hypothetical protein [Corynebacterium sanguinis]MCT1492046.1 hypothetical protein [Corynebacterium sanguinis]